MTPKMSIVSTSGPHTSASFSHKSFSPASNRRQKDPIINHHHTPAHVLSLPVNHTNPMLGLPHNQLPQGEQFFAAFNHGQDQYAAHTFRSWPSNLDPTMGLPSNELPVEQQSDFATDNQYAFEDGTIMEPDYGNQMHASGTINMPEVGPGEHLRFKMREILEVDPNEHHPDDSSNVDAESETDDDLFGEQQASDTVPSSDTISHADEDAQESIGEEIVGNQGSQPKVFLRLTNIQQNLKDSPPPKSLLQSRSMTPAVDGTSNKQSTLSIQNPNGVNSEKCPATAAAIAAKPKRKRQPYRPYTVLVEKPRKVPVKALPKSQEVNSNLTNQTVMPTPELNRTRKRTPTVFFDEVTEQRETGQPPAKKTKIVDFDYVRQTSQTPKREPGRSSKQAVPKETVTKQATPQRTRSVSVGSAGHVDAQKTRAVSVGSAKEVTPQKNHAASTGYAGEITPHKTHAVSTGSAGAYNMPAPKTVPSPPTSTEPSPPPRHRFEVKVSDHIKRLYKLLSGKGYTQLPDVSEGDKDEPYTAERLTHLYIYSVLQNDIDFCDLIADTWIRAFQSRNRRRSSYNRIWIDNRRHARADRENKAKWVKEDMMPPVPKWQNENPLPELDEDVTGFDPSLLNQLYHHTPENNGARLIWADALALCGPLAEELFTDHKKENTEWHEDLKFNVTCTALRLARRHLTLKIEEIDDDSWCRRYHTHSKCGQSCYLSEEKVKAGKEKQKQTRRKGKAPAGGILATIQEEESGMGDDLDAQIMQGLEDMEDTEDIRPQKHVKFALPQADDDGIIDFGDYEDFEDVMEDYPEDAAGPSNQPITIDDDSSDDDDSESDSELEED